MECQEESAASDTLALRAWQSVVKRHVNKAFVNVFSNLTGLRLWIFWHRPAELRRNEFKICPNAQRGPCEACLQQRWGTDRYRARTEPFTGACGKTNYWASLVVEKTKVVTFVLEAHLSAAPAARAAVQDESTHESGVATVMPAAFERAVALLRLLIQELTEVVEVARLGEALTTTRRQLRASECETARLREARLRRLPALACPRSGPACESHAQAVVRQMLEFVHQHYHRPMTLAEVAAALGMNASYLSSLFSRTTGLAFHSYLGELRLAKAKELLSDPLKRVAEVACAVGYSSDDWFRHAFRAQTGLSPSEWRGAQLPG